MTSTGFVERPSVEDRRLLQRYRNQGDAYARDELVKRFAPLTRKVARRYARGREPLDDLVQVANLGLVKAIDRFDLGRENSFMSYAMPTMIGEIKRYFRDCGWSLQVPRGMKERTKVVEEGARSFSSRQGRSPSVAELAAAVSLTEEEVVEALEAARAYDTVSLEEPTTGSVDSPEREVSDTIGNEDDRYELAELRASISPALKELPERERRILHLRFAEHRTQSEIAARVGVSQMHVSRLIRRALNRVRQSVDDPGHSLRRSP